MEEYFGSCDKFSEKTRQDAVLCLRTLLGLERQYTAYVPAQRMLGKIGHTMISMNDIKSCLTTIVVILKKLLFGADEPWPFRTHFVCQGNEAPITLYYTLETLPDIYIGISEASLLRPDSLTIQLCHQFCRLLVLKQTEDIYTDHGIPLGQSLLSLQKILKLPYDLVSKPFPCCLHKRDKANHEIDAGIDHMYLFYSFQVEFPLPRHMKATHILSNNDFIAGRNILMMTFMNFMYNQVSKLPIRINGVDNAVDICKIILPNNTNERIRIEIYEKAYTNYDEFSEAVVHQFSRVQLYFQEKLNHLPSCTDERFKKMLKIGGQFLPSPTRPKYYCCRNDFKSPFEVAFNEFLHFFKSLSLDFLNENRHSKAADFIHNYDTKRVLLSEFLLQVYSMFELIEKPFNSNRIVFVDQLSCSEGLTVWTGKNHKDAVILLSHEVVNKPETLRDVLLHQLCLVDVGNSKESFSNHGLKYVAKIRNIRIKIPFPMKYSRVKSGCCNTLVNIPCSETKYFLKSILMQKLNKCHREAKLAFIGFQTYHPSLAELLSHMFDKIMFENALTSQIELLFSTGFSACGRTTPIYFHYLNYSLDNDQLPCIRFKYESYTMELNSIFHQNPANILLTLLHEMCHVAEIHLDRVVNEDHGPTWHNRVVQCYKRFPTIPKSRQFANYKRFEFHHYVCNCCKTHTSSPQLIDVRKMLCGNCNMFGLHLLRMDLNAIQLNL